MNQLAINFDAKPGQASAALRCADAAVLRTLADGDRRSLQILIALWHDYTHDEVRQAIEQLLTSGKIIQVGLYQSNTPEVVVPIRDEIYRIGVST